MTVGPDPDERALVLRAQDGDPAAFEQLVDLHQGRLFRIAFMVTGDRQEAEDVVQETLVLAWRRLHLLEEPAAFRGWVAQICSRSATE
jgi:RNA polymerase sigma-70 factor (ECF subfamily)